jgi:hypothetical protein
VNLWKVFNITYELLVYKDNKSELCIDKLITYEEDDFYTNIVEQLPEVENN